MTKRVFQHQNFTFFKFGRFFPNLWPKTAGIIISRVLGSGFSNFHIEDHGLADLVVLTGNEIWLKSILGTQRSKAKIVSFGFFALIHVFLHWYDHEQFSSFIHLCLKSL